MRAKQQRLYINIDHVATLRQARRGAEPDPVEAAIVCEAAGAGLKVALVDAGDFGGATSSGSSKLIHGGFLLRFQFFGQLLLIRIVVTADIGRNRKTGRDGNAGIGHLGQACAFAAQQIFH